MIQLRLYRSADREQVARLEERALRDAGVDPRVEGSPGEGGRNANSAERISPASELLNDEPREQDAEEREDGGELWVGELDGDIVAMGAFCPTPGETAEICRLRVGPEWQGRGFGRLMLDKLEERAAERGCRLVHLQSPAGREAAQRLFESAGYTMHERMLRDGGKTFLYAKWLVPPEAAKEMTPEEEAKFYVDWDLSQELTGYAKSLLREGASPQQAMEAVLGSELYAAWNGTERCFQVHYEGIELYNDLLDNVESEAYIANIEHKTALCFEAAAKGDSAADLIAEQPDEAEERVLAQMGMRVTLSRLAWEMAQFSRAIGFAKPIRYLHFLSLFSGATIVDLEQDELDMMVANKEMAIKLAEAFAAKYGDDLLRSDDS